MNNLDFRIFKRYKPEYAKCVNCGAAGTLKKYRSRGLVDNIAKIFLLKKFFCKNCQWKGRYFTVKLTKHWLRAVLFYLIAIAGTIFIIYNYLERFL